LPDDRVDLYQQCSCLLLHQWDTERALGDFPGLSEEIGLREKTTILRTVAYAMQTQQTENTRANYIDGETLEGLIEEYLRDELHFQKARKASRALVDQLRQRNFILCYLGGDSYAFVHRTFLEYFCATEVVHQFNVSKTLDIEGLIGLFDEHCRDDDWREVLRLICGQIDEKFVGRIVEHLATRTDLDKWDGETPLPELPLAIGCLSEQRNFSRLDTAGQSLMRQTIAMTSRVRENDELKRFMLDDMAAVCRDLGKHWPGADELNSVVFSQLDHIPSGYGEEFWPLLVAYVLEDRNIVSELLVTNRGVNSWSYRFTAIQALVEKWPTEDTRQLITERAVQDESELNREAALQELVKYWQDDNTRKLLEQRAVQDEYGYSHSTALQELAKYWQDEKTRELLEQLAVQDENDAPRSTALQELAKYWQDEKTRELLEQRAVQDEGRYSRSTALQELAKYWQ
ncbi:MAG: hypothetical protein D3918_16195, partial [Candidatus Electrothrix sp. AX2]|nr:hypothetical protein [Candidatus Electrothrix gigas]